MFTLDIGCCSTDFLLENEFRMLTQEKKEYIIKLGRSTPNIQIELNNIGKDEFHKQFNRKLYDEFSWLTGSCRLNRLFCFPCVLCTDNSNSLWGRTGIVDIENLHAIGKKHVQTEEHIRYCLTLHKYDIKNIGADRSMFQVYNRKVARNRELLKRYVDIIIFFVGKELDLGEQNSIIANNQDNYVEMVEYLAKYDPILEFIMEQQRCTAYDPNFFNLSKEIQNELISCLASIVRNQIKNEISKCRFVSISVAETRDSSLEDQRSLVVRYLVGHEIQERFLGYFDIVARYSASELSIHILNMLANYNCKEKLIGQSYDGTASVISDEEGGVQSIVREACPMAISIPSQSHALNIVLTRSLENIPEMKLFFGHINNVIDFFRKSTKRSSYLKLILQTQKNEVNVTRWDYHSETINILFSCRVEIITTFKRMLQDTEDWDSESLSLAEGLLKKLEDKKFIFLLHATSEIFTKTNQLSNEIKSDPTQIPVISLEIETLQSWLCSELMDKFESIYFSDVDINDEPSLKRQKLNQIIDIDNTKPFYLNDSKEYLKQLLTEIRDNIVIQINNRYNQFSELKFLNCFNKSVQFLHKRAPGLLIASFSMFFPNIFDEDVLKNELRIINTTPSMKTQEIRKYYDNFQSPIFKDTFPQFWNLFSIYLTLPISDGLHIVKSSSVLRRINMYLQNVPTNKKTLDLALLSIERQLLMQIRSSSDFDERVLEEFSKRNKTIELMFK